MSFENSMHNLALQLSNVAQKYEEYWQEIERTSQRYEELPAWVTSILGEVTPATSETMGAVQAAREAHVASIRNARNMCLEIAQAIIRAGGGGTAN